MKKTFSIILSLILTVTFFQSNIFASGTGEVKVVKNNLATELEQASTLEMNTIVVITDNKETELEEALTLANDAAGINGNSMVAVLNREAKENEAIISKYNLGRFPAPYVLILSPNGLITGGVPPGKVSAERLANYIPSKCYNKVLGARHAGKSAFILVYNEENDAFNNWMTAVKEAGSSMENSPELITIKADDENEKMFLSRIGYKNTEEPVLVVFNAGGQNTGKFTEIPESKVLTEAATKVASKGCGSSCPSSKSCSGKEKAGCGDK